MTIAEALSIRINSLLNVKEWSLSHVARRGGTTQSTVNYILRNKNAKPTLPTIMSVAYGFDMTLSEFLDFPEINQITVDDLKALRLERGKEV